MMTAKWLSFRKRYWLALGCALGILAIYLILFHAVPTIRRAADRAQRQNCLRQIWHTLRTFHDSYDCLPPAVRKDKAGRPLCSWRFQTAPFLQSWMYLPPMEFDQPWDSKANQFWVKMDNKIYCWAAEEDSPERFHTNVVAVTGPGTPFGVDRQNRLQDMARGTILLVEIAHSGIHWMEPRDLPLDRVPESLVRGLDGDGFHVVFADGQSWFLSADVPLEDVRKFLTIEGAKKHDRDQVLGPYALSRSRWYPPGTEK
jgi:hypothetical protein